MKRVLKHHVAVEIGLGLSHSQDAIEFIKKNNFALYLILMKIDGKKKVGFFDIMILENSDPSGNYYSCPLCKTSKLYSAAFDHAKKHFESHLFELEEILAADRDNFSLEHFY